MRKLVKSLAGLFNPMASDPLARQTMEVRPTCREVYLTYSVLEISRDDLGLIVGISIISRIFWCNELMKFWAPLSLDFSTTFRVVKCWFGTPNSDNLWSINQREQEFCRSNYSFSQPSPISQLEEQTCRLFLGIPGHLQWHIWIAQLVLQWFQSIPKIRTNYGHLFQMGMESNKSSKSPTIQYRNLIMN